MSREEKRISIRSYPETLAQLKQVAQELVLSYVDRNGKRWWAREEGPTLDEVIQYLLRHYRDYRDRQRRAGTKRNARKKALRACFGQAHAPVTKGP